MTAREEAESRCTACDQPHRGERRYDPSPLGWHDFEEPDLKLITRRVIRTLRRQGLIG